jgi:hypothetical protein
LKNYTNQRQKKLVCPGLQLRPLDDRSESIDDNEENKSLLLWAEVSQLRNGLETWKEELCKVFKHSREISETEFNLLTNGLLIEAEKLDHDSKMGRMGRRIEEKLEEIMVEFDETQVLHNRSRRDNTGWLISW